MDIIQKAKEVINFPDSRNKKALIDLISRLVDRLEWKPINSCDDEPIIRLFWLEKNEEKFNGAESIIYIGLLGLIPSTYTAKYWMPLPPTPVGDK